MTNTNNAPTTAHIEAAEAFAAEYNRTRWVQDALEAIGPLVDKILELEEMVYPELYAQAILEPQEDVFV